MGFVRTRTGFGDATNHKLRVSWLSGVVPGLQRVNGAGYFCLSKQVSLLPSQATPPVASGSLGPRAVSPGEQEKKPMRLCSEPTPLHPAPPQSPPQPRRFIPRAICWVLSVTLSGSHCLERVTKGNRVFSARGHHRYWIKCLFGALDFRTGVFLFRKNRALELEG